MKNLIIRFCIFIFTFFLFYLIGAFVNVSFDLSKWTEVSRIAIAIFGTFVSGALASAPFLEIEE